MYSHALPWIPMYFLGFSWILMDFVGFHGFHVFSRFYVCIFLPEVNIFPEVDILLSEVNIFVGGGYFLQFI